MKGRLLFITVWICLGIFYSFSLGKIGLWDDEGHTAVTARRVLETGLPKAWDGRNLVTGMNGMDFNDDFITTMSTWPQYYIAAASFFLFGESTETARLPFVLIGWLSLGLLWWFGRRVLKDPWVAWAAFLFLAVQPQFILHIRQCRYYALLMAGMVVYLIGSSEEVRSRKKEILAAVGLAFIFHSQPWACAAVWSAEAFVILLAARSQLKSFLRISLITAVLVLPWWFYVGGVGRIHALSRGEGWNYLWHSAREMHGVWNGTVFPSALLIIAPLAAGSLTPFRQPMTWRLIAIAVSSLLLIPYFGYPVIRYSLHFLPLSAVLAALLLKPLWERRRVWGILILILAAVTPLFKKFPWCQDWRRNGLAAYLSEIGRPYCDPIQEVAGYLKTHASPDDFVVTNFDRVALMFYIPQRFAGVLSPDGPYPKRRARFPEYVTSADFIDWYIPRTIPMPWGPYDEPAPFLRSLRSRGFHMEPVPLHCPNRNWDGNWPEHYEAYIDRHLWLGPVPDGEADGIDTIMIYRVRKVS